MLSTAKLNFTVVCTQLQLLAGKMENVNEDLKYYLLK